MELVGDGYHADVIGEATPDFLLKEFVCCHFLESNRKCLGCPETLINSNI